MVDDKYLYFEDLAGWRKWLEENHATEKELWLVYYKVHTERPSIPYSDSVEEALCYGWIDSLIKKLDGDRYARKFTPRRPGSNWSPTNKKRVRKLIREGRMLPEGMVLVDFPIDEPDDEPALILQELNLSDELLKTLQANTKAWENFCQLPPSHKRNYVGWIMSAKKDDTRKRRFDEAISLLAQGKRLGMK